MYWEYYFFEISSSSNTETTGNAGIPLLWIFYGDFKIQTPTSGIQLMKIACKSINWPKNTFHMDANARESVDRENLEFA